MRVRMLDRRTVLAAMVGCAAVTLPGCGYALQGRANNLPDYIRIIGVPLLVNHSTIPDLEEKLTDALRTEFQGHGHYKAVPEAEGVDGLLTGSINAVTFTPVEFSQTRQISRLAVKVSASIEFRDVKQDKVLW